MLTFATKIHCTQRLQDIVSETRSAARAKGNPPFVLAEVLRGRPKKDVNDVAENETEQGIRQTPCEVDDQFQPAFPRVEFVAEQYACLQAVEQAEREADHSRRTHRHDVLGNKIRDDCNDDAQHDRHSDGHKTFQRLRHWSSRVLNSLPVPAGPGQFQCRKVRHSNHATALTSPMMPPMSRTTAQIAAMIPMMIAAIMSVMLTRTIGTRPCRKLM